MGFKKRITTSIITVIVAGLLIIVTGLLIDCSQNKVEATTEKNINTLKKLSSIDLGNAIAYEVEDTKTGRRFMVSIVKGQGGIAIEELSY